MVSKLANFVQRYYPGLSRSKAYNVIVKVRKLNNGKLVGLKLDRFVKLLKIVMEKSNAGHKKQKQEEIEEAKKDKSGRTCQFCFQLFIEKFSKERHVKIVHQNQPATPTDLNISENFVKCNQCDKVFSHQSSLKRHLRIHEKGLESFGCTDCDKTFTRKDSLWKHRERVHRLFKTNFDAIRPNNSGNFVCKMCNASFQKNIEALNAHLATKICMRKDGNLQIDAGGNFKCNHCDKSFTNVSGLNRHIAVKHERSKEFQCHLCQKIFSYKFTLKKHIKKLHSQEYDSENA